MWNYDSQLHLKSTEITCEWTHMLALETISPQKSLVNFTINQRNGKVRHWNKREVFVIIKTLEIEEPKYLQAFNVNDMKHVFV